MTSSLRCRLGFHNFVGEPQFAYFKKGTRHECGWEMWYCQRCDEWLNGWTYRSGRRIVICTDQPRKEV